MSLLSSNVAFDADTSRMFSVSFLVLASKIIRPGHVYRISVTNFSPHTVTTHASILRDGLDIASTSQDCSIGVPETMILRINPQAYEGTYKLKIEGRTAADEVIFSNQTKLEFNQRSLTILVQTDKPVYKQGQTVKFRTLPLTTDLKAFSDAIDVYMLDPNKIIVKRWLSKQTNLGSVSLEYQLSKQPALGNWTIRVFAQGQFEDSNFLVEEYYSQQYEVKVEMPNEILDTEEYIHGTISSNYTNGAPVLGNLTVVLTAEMGPISGSATEIEPVFHGVYQLKYKMSDFKKLLGQRSLFDAKIRDAKLTVTAYIGEQYLDVFDFGFAKVRIVPSRIKLEFLGSSVYIFKPAMPFDCFLALSHLDGTFYNKDQIVDEYLDVRVTAINKLGSMTLSNRTVEIIANSPGIWKLSVDPRQVKQTLSDLDHLRIDATFSDHTGIRTNAVANAYPAFSQSPRSLQVTTSTVSPHVGGYIIFHVAASYKLEMVSYIIMSKGMILLSGRERIKSTPSTFAVPVSAEMAPSSTIVIYDVAKNVEVILDSFTFHVDGTSLHNLDIKLNSFKDKQGESVEVIVTGQPGTYVGLSAYSKEFSDIAVNDQLSRLQLEQKMRNFDNKNNLISHHWHGSNGQPKETLYFPSPTDSIDAKVLLDNLGLLMFTDAQIPSKNRVPCAPGFSQCSITDRCYNASIHRCNGKNDCGDNSDEAWCDPSIDLYNSRIQEHLYRVNRLERVFENNWLWVDLNIDDSGKYIFKAKLPRIQSQWTINAISMSPLDGLSIPSDLVQISNISPFTLNVDLPPHCNLGEQISIRTILSNFADDETTAMVTLKSSPYYSFVSIDEDSGELIPFSYEHFKERQHLIQIKPQETKYIYIPIVARKVGDINVTITAETQVVRRTITKQLKVSADGITQYSHISLALDLSKGSYLLKHLDTNITESPIVKYDNMRRYMYGSNKATISVAGGNVGPILATIPANTSTLLRLPADCGEQNMFNFAINLISISHLRFTSQDTPEIRREIFKYLNLLYQKQLTFRNKDGSFRIFRNSEAPSVWLTAFSVQYFHHATSQDWENYIYIDPEVIDSAIAWLVSKQNHDGSFHESTFYSYDRKLEAMIPKQGHGLEDIRAKNISLTAYVLIALSNVRDRSGEQSTRANFARNSAQTYLETMLHRSTIKTAYDPFDLSIVTYALQVVNSIEVDEAYNYLARHVRLQPGMRYWSIEATVPNLVNAQNNRYLIYPRARGAYDSRNVQTTSYALLTHIQRQAPFQADIVEWLNSQRLTSGGWASTQDTILAMQALMAYSRNTEQRSPTNLKLIIEGSAFRDSNKENTFVIKDTNISRANVLNVPNAFGIMSVKAEGSGIGILSLDVQYNVDWAQLQIRPAFKSFELDIRPSYSGRNSSNVHMDICARWTMLSESPRSGMAVLEVPVPTGYIVSQTVLNRLVNSTSPNSLYFIRNLRESRITDTKVYFYFDYIDDKRTCVQFTLNRWYPVANMTRYLPVKVYDYYAPERYNETMLELYNLYALRICDVCGSSQCKYCSDYLHNAANVIYQNFLFIVQGTIIASTLVLLQTIQVQISFQRLLMFST